jgi:tetratricopeptide (TPR) repeat protein
MIEDRESHMTNNRQAKLIAVLAVLILSFPPQPLCVLAAETNRLTVALHYDPDKDGALWLGYLVARSAYVDQHMSAYEQKVGVITPTFEEEVQARTQATLIFRELEQKNKGSNDPYFGDLDQISSGGFMREYVWTYLHQDSWGNAPSDLRLAVFDQWRMTHLVDHKVITRGNIAFEERTESKAAKSAEPGKSAARLTQGKDVMMKGNPQKAIHDYFDPVIAHFELLFKNSPARIYSAQNQVQMIMYAAMPEKKGGGTQVLDGTWADAYLLKAYALTELMKIEDAQVALKAAMALSPMNSLYVSELAYTYQAQKDCAKSIATYEEAAGLAELGSDEQSKTNDLTRAWRGEGYCLVEQGKLDLAEAMYKKSIALDPHDDRSRGELNYIRGLRQ